MEQQEYNQPLPTIHSKSKAVPVPTVLVAGVAHGNEYKINWVDYDEKLHRVIDGTDVKLLGEKTPMNADEKLMATLESMTDALRGNGSQGSAPADGGELEAARAKIAELNALVLAAHEEAAQAKNGDGKVEPAQVAQESKPAPAKKKTSKRKPRRVEAKK